MRYFVVHLLMLLSPIYSSIHSNEFFQEETILQNSIVLTFKPSPQCDYDVQISVWPPIINVTEKGGEVVLFYEAPTYIDMEKITAHRKGELVHFVLPKRMIKMDRIPTGAKMSRTVYLEIDAEAELERMM